MPEIGSYVHGKAYARQVAGMPAEVRTPESEHRMATDCPQLGDMGGTEPATEHGLARSVLTIPPYNGLTIGPRRFCGLV